MNLISIHFLKSFRSPTRLLWNKTILSTNWALELRVIKYHWPANCLSLKFDLTNETLPSSILFLLKIIIYCRFKTEQLYVLTGTEHVNIALSDLMFYYLILAVKQNPKIWAFTLNNYAVILAHNTAEPFMHQATTLL